MMDNNKICEICGRSGEGVRSIGGVHLCEDCWPSGETAPRGVLWFRKVVCSKCENNKWCSQLDAPKILRECILSEILRHLFIGGE
ncbi:MAG: hypothetical protein ACXQT5_01800 [Candidatus Syntropharchaeia archaeon]